MMTDAHDWRPVYDFWFPPGLEEANIEVHGRMFGWWFAGGANAAMQHFAPLIKAARADRLAHWLASPRGRLALILVLDQFPRGVCAGRAEAYHPTTTLCGWPRLACGTGITMP